MGNGRCQTDAHSSQFVGNGNLSGRQKTAPICERGDAVGLEVLSAGEASLLVEVVEDRGVNRCKLLQCSHAPEAEHGPLPPSKRLVRVVSTIVRTTTGFLPIADVEFTQGGTIGPEAVGHDFI
jgi:hypothetical protein